MANVGKIFEGEVRAFLECNYALVGREPDVMGKRFVLPKNFDFYACSRDGRFVGVEAKATRAKVFGFNRLKAHQREALTTIADAGGQAFLALNMRGGNVPGHAWFIPWGWFLDFSQLWRKKSIRLDEAVREFAGFELRRITGGWEISKQLRINGRGINQ